MSEDSQTLAEVKHELIDKIDSVDCKIDAVDERLSAKIDAVDERLSAKIDAVDCKIDAVDGRLSAKIDSVDERLSAKIDQTRTELTTLIGATATSLEARIDRKLDGMEQRLTKVAERSAEAVVDQAVHRVVGAVYELSQRDAAIRDDRMDALERRLDEHVSNERIHVDD